MSATRCLTLVFTPTIKMVTEDCNQCNLTFAMPAWFQEKRLADKAPFYCPNGHKMWFTGETETQRLRRQLDEQVREATQQAQRAADAREKLKATTTQLRATKTRLQNTKKRHAAGVCPCCQRTFRQLVQHMATQHPDYKS